MAFAAALPVIGAVVGRVLGGTVARSAATRVVGTAVARGGAAAAERGAASGSSRVLNFGAEAQRTGIGMTSGKYVGAAKDYGTQVGLQAGSNMSSQNQNFQDGLNTAGMY